MDKRLKNSVIKFLKSESRSKDPDKDIAISNTSRSYTYNDLIKEIENETDFGESFIEDRYDKLNNLENVT